MTTIGQLYNADVTKTVAATASGNTTIWQPTAPRVSIRLQGYILSVDGASTLAAAGTNVIQLTDNAGNTFGNFGPFIPAGAVAFGDEFVVGPVFFQGGFVTPLLRVNLSVALTNGAVRVVAWGSEE